MLLVVVGFLAGKGRPLNTSQRNRTTNSMARCERSLPNSFSTRERLSTLYQACFEQRHMDTGSLIIDKFLSVWKPKRE